MEVVIPERWKGRSVEFAPDMQPRLAWLNNQLCAAESWFDDCARWFKQLAVKYHPDRPDTPWMLHIGISFVLDKSDPEHDEDSDNIICEMFDTLPLMAGDENTCYPKADWSRDFRYEPDHPLHLWKHCWLTRVLMDGGHPTLGWKNMVRIGRIWAEAILVLDRTFALDPSAAVIPALPTGSSLSRSWEGDNWKKVLFSKRYPQSDRSGDILTCDDIARLDQLNTLMGGIETYLDACGRWFHGASSGDDGVPEAEDGDRWDMEARMEFLLDHRDPLFENDGGNTLYVTNHNIAYRAHGTYSDSSLIDGEIDNWNEFEHQEGHPLRHQHHCWLFHDLYDHSHPPLGWQNILRIGSVRASTQIRFAQSFPPLEEG